MEIPEVSLVILIHHIYRYVYNANRILLNKLLSKNNYLTNNSHHLLKHIPNGVQYLIYINWLDFKLTN